MTGWQPIDTAPKDGTEFLALQGKVVFSVFFRRNPNNIVVRPVTLQVIMRNNRYSAAGRWFLPTHWMPRPKLPV